VEDPNGMTLWAGTSFREARPGPAADIVAGLAAAY
jgi:nitronate monooxygenase